MPSRPDILARAQEMYAERQIRSDLPGITPTEQELKEAGVYEEARLDLMTTTQKTLSDQERYLNDVAAEMGYEVMSKEELKGLYKRVKQAELQEKDKTRIERPRIPLPGKDTLGRAPEFLVRANTPELLNKSEHQAALEVALARGRLSLEKAIVKAAEEHRMRHFIQYVRDLNLLKTLQWKIRQENGVRL